MKTKLLKKVRRRFKIYYVFRSEDKIFNGIRKMYGTTFYMFVDTKDKDGSTTSYHSTKNEAISRVITRMRNIYLTDVKPKEIGKVEIEY